MKLGPTISIYVHHSVNGKRLERIIANVFENTYPRFTPRGDSILYFSKKHTKNVIDELYLHKIITNADKVLTARSYNNNFADWSINILRLAYASVTESGNPEIFFMNKDGKSVRQITFNTGGSTLPHWSPKDINLLITGKREGREQICKILLKEKL